MKIVVKAVVNLEYDLRDGTSLEELTDEALDQIKNGEYFPSRVKDVHITSVQEAS